MDMVAEALNALACARPKSAVVGPRPETPEEIADSVLFDLIDVIERCVNTGEADRTVALGIVRDVLKVLDDVGGGDSPRLTMQVSNDEESRRLVEFFRGRGESWPEPGTPVSFGARRSMLGELKSRYAKAGHDGVTAEDEARSGHTESIDN